MSKCALYSRLEWYAFKGLAEIIPAREGVSCAKYKNVQEPSFYMFLHSCGGR